MNKIKYHEAANIFPMMQDIEYKQLCADIKANGLLEPIVMYENQILDGRNRYEACIEGGVEPQYRQWNGKGNVIDFVVSMNLNRRHLDSGQKAMCALKAEKLLGVQAKARQLAALKQGDSAPVAVNLQQREKGRAAEQAAKMFNVSASSVYHAKKLKANAPDLAQKVRAGEITLNKAMRQEKKITDERRILSVTPIQGKFKTLVIDPAWDYEGLSLAGRAAPDYATMTHNELLDLNVQGWADDACHLYLWTTNNFITKAAELMAHWGFQYKTILTWTKPRFGLGSYFRNQTEHVLFGVKGNLTTRADNISTIIDAPIGKHSEKPDKFYSIVMQASYPPYGEAFQRTKRKHFKNLFEEITE